MSQAQSTIAHDIIDTFSAGDLEACRALVDPDVIYEETGTGRRVQGADAYVELLRGWRAAFPDVAGKVTSGVESGNQVALEITWSGTAGPPRSTTTSTCSPCSSRSAPWADHGIIAPDSSACLGMPSFR